MAALTAIMLASAAAAADPFPWRNDTANLALTAAWNN
jgi:hypothetical protein